MLTFIAAILFSAAAMLALGVIAWMFALYRDKMVAALLFEPIPDVPPVYELRIRRPRAVRQTAPVATRPASMQARGMIAA